MKKFSQCDSMSAILSSPIIAIAILSLSIAMPGFCQEEAESGKAPPVPEVVKKAFTEKFPKAEAPVWEVDSKGNWEAKFSDTGKAMRADFSIEGQWKKTESDVTIEKLPEAVKKSIETAYAGKEIDDIEWVSHAEKGDYYDVEFKKVADEKKIGVKYRADGTPVK